MLKNEGPFFYWGTATEKSGDSEYLQRRQPSVFQGLQKVLPPETHSYSLWNFYVLRVHVIFISEPHFVF